MKTAGTPGNTLCKPLADRVPGVSHACVVVISVVRTCPVRASVTFPIPGGWGGLGKYHTWMASLNVTEGDLSSSCPHETRDARCSVIESWPRPHRLSFCNHPKVDLQSLHRAPRPKRLIPIFLAKGKKIWGLKNAP